MKHTFLSLLILLMIGFSACKKDKKMETIPVPTEKYSSLDDFYAKHEVKMQSYTIDASTGGSFTSPQGTKVTIPSNCFETFGSAPVTGSVTIQFKDIYSKTDMLLSDIPTNYYNGTPLKSGGEFFINALQNNEALQIASGKKIEVEQPLQGLPLDTAMEPMELRNPIDTMQGGVAAPAWFISQDYDLLFTSTSYIFTLYSFATNGAGSWCNSDNPYYFSTYTLTGLTVNPVEGYNQDVFLIFNDIQSMIHVYGNGTNFHYSGTPVGLNCTVVMIAVKDEVLYASFTPITVTPDMVVNPTLSPITSDELKAKIDALN